MAPCGDRVTAMQPAGREGSTSGCMRTPARARCGPGRCARSRTSRSSDTAPHARPGTPLACVAWCVPSVGRSAICRVVEFSQGAGDSAGGRRTRLPATRRTKLACTRCASRPPSRRLEDRVRRGLPALTLTPTAALALCPPVIAIPSRGNIEMILTMGRRVLVSCAPLRTAVAARPPPAPRPAAASACTQPPSSLMGDLSDA